MKRPQEVHDKENREREIHTHTYSADDSNSSISRTVHVSFYEPAMTTTKLPLVG